MKTIMFASVGIWPGTGYGKVSRYLAFGLANRGFRVVTFANQLTRGYLTLNNVLILPRRADPFGNDVILDYCKFLGVSDIVTLFDVWVLDKFAQEVKDTSYNWYPITPVDAPLDDACDPILKPLESARIIIAMSKFGERELSKFFDNVVYIPHGVDTSLYHPIPREKRNELRKQLGFPEDAFIFGHVAANYSERKDFPHLYKAFRIFLDNLPENERKKVILYHHTEATGPMGLSYDIYRLAKKYNIRENLRVPNVDLRIMPLPEEALARLYNTFDVYVTASRGEGFGVPIIEALASGIPVIAPANTSHIELVSGHGWLVDKFSGWEVPLHTPVQQEYPIVDEYALADAMLDAYNHPEKIQEYGKKAKEFAKSYDWNNILDDFEVLLK